MATFSIITVVYNGADLLRGTIGSVMAQSAQDKIEYLLIDGASTDNSLDIIKEFAAKMPNIRWVSEPDKGLYDAMNKAIKMATGDFLWFMNGGDYIHGYKTVEKLSELADNTKADVLYGETMLINDDGDPQGTMSQLSTRNLPKQLTKSSFLGGMKVVHQSFLPRRAISPLYIDDNLCADYDWCLHILEKSKKNVNAEMILSQYLMGGISKKHHKQSLKDRFNVMKKHFGLVRTLFAHAWILLRAPLHKIMRLGKPTY